MMMHPVQLSALLLSLCVLGGCGNDANGTQSADASVQASSAAAAAADTLTGEPPRVDLTEVGFDKGEPGSDKVYVIEFSDFGCVYCAGFHEDTYPALRDEFIDGGDVVWKYVPVTIGGFPNTEWAAAASFCAAEQDDFPTLRDRIYSERDAWMAASEADAPGLLTSFARDEGYDGDAFEACMARPETMETVESTSRMAVEVGIRATPTFVVAGYPVEGAPPLESFREAIQELLAQIRTPADG
ncbi:MAG: hypothetical protein EA352_05670 [Gemmatimonadales bacterium]|nr:MAG: hypothetical protein EA352_05670 [Gemmatimonadales bacterium]